MDSFFKDVRKTQDPGIFLNVDSSINDTTETTISQVNSSPKTNETTYKENDNEKDAITDNDEEVLPRNEVILDQGDQTILTQVTQQLSSLTSQDTYQVYIKLINDLQHKCTSLTNQLNKSNSKFSLKSKELNITELKLKKVRDLFKSLIEKFNSLNNQIIYLKNSNNDSSDKLNQFNIDLNYYKNKVKSCKEFAKSDSKLVENLKQSINIINSKIYQKDCKIELLETTIDNLSGNLSEEKLCVNKLQTQLFDMNESHVKKMESMSANFIILNESLPEKLSFLLNSNILEFTKSIEEFSNKLNQSETIQRVDFEEFKLDFNSHQNVFQSSLSDLDQKFMNSRNELILQNLEILELVRDQPELAKLLSSFQQNITKGLSNMQHKNDNCLLELKKYLETSAIENQNVKSNHENVVAKLEDIIKANDDSKQELLNRLKINAKSIEELRKAVTVNDQEKALLGTKLDNLQECNASIQKSLGETTQRVVDLTNELADAKKCQDLNHQIESLEKMVSLQETENKYLTSQNMELEANLEKLRLSIRDLENLQTVNEEERLKYIKLSTAQDEKISELQNQNTTQETKLKGFKSKLKDKESLVNELKENIKQFGISVEKSKSEIRAMKLSLENEKSEKNKCNNTLEALRVSNMKLARDIIQLKEEGETRSTEFMQSERSLQDLIRLYQLKNEKSLADLLQSQSINTLQMEKLENLQKQNEELTSQLNSRCESNNSKKLAPLKRNDDKLHCDKSRLQKQLTKTQTQVGTSSRVAITNQSTLLENTNDIHDLIRSKIVSPATNSKKASVKVTKKSKSTPKVSELNSSQHSSTVAFNVVSQKKNQGVKRPAADVYSAIDDEVGLALFDIFSSTKKLSGNSQVNKPIPAKRGRKNQSTK